jgi:hypothetical protein
MVTLSGSTESSRTRPVADHGSSVAPTRGRSLRRGLWRAFFAAYASISAAWLGAAVWFALHPSLTPTVGTAAVTGFRTWLSHIAGFVISAATFSIGLFILGRFKGETTARFLALGMVGTAAAFNADAPRFMTPASFSVGGALSVGQEVFLVVAAGAYVLGLSSLVLSEDGNELSIARTSGRWLGMVLAFGMATLAGVTSWAHVPGKAIPLLGAGLLSSGLIIQGYHAFRAGATECERASARIFSGVLFVVGFFSALAAVSLMWLSGLKPGFGHLLNTRVALVIFPAILTGLPVALLLGILRHPKDLLKGLEYTVLSAAITVGYVTVHILIDLVMRGKAEAELNLAPDSLLSTALITLFVVVTFDGLKEWLTHWARVWVFADTAEPEAPLVRFSEELAKAQDRRALLDLIAKHARDNSGAIASSVDTSGTRMAVPVGTTGNRRSHPRFRGRRVRRGQAREHQRDRPFGAQVHPGVAEPTETALPPRPTGAPELRRRRCPGR